MQNVAKKQAELEVNCANLASELEAEKASLSAMKQENETLSGAKADLQIQVQYLDETVAG